MKSVIIILCISLFSVVAFGQPGNPGPPDDEIPIDAGVGLLIAAGAAFGIKKVHDFNKKKK